MTTRNPSGTFTKPAPPAIGTTVPKLVDRTQCCCCTISRPAMAVIMASLYIITAVLSGLSVGGGIEDHMTQYQGQVQVNANYTVTRVTTSSINLRTGWLKYYNGTLPARPRDLTELSRGSGALGYVLAFLLLVSLLVATWRVVSIAWGGSKALQRGSVCLGVLVSLVIIIILITLYASTSRDLDNLAHNSLKIPSSNNIAMEPGYAWFCGFFAALMWTVIAMTSLGLPDRVTLEYHQF